MYGMVFTQVFRRLIVVAGIGLLSSCAGYRIFEVEVLEPSKVKLQKDCRILLLDRNIRFEKSPIVFVDTMIEKTLIVDFANGINFVASEMKYDTVNYYCEQHGEKIKNDHRPLFLSRDSIDLICQKWNATHLLSMDLAYYKYIKGKISLVRLMSCYEKGSLQPLDTVLLVQTLPEPIYDDMDLLWEDIRTANWDAGAACGQRLFTRWLRTERRVYNQGRVLALGDYCLQKGNIDEAIKIWESVCLLSPSKAIRARINLAWIYENNGDFEKALEMLEEADRIVQEKKIYNQVTIYLKDYMKIIRQRIEGWKS